MEKISLFLRQFWLLVGMGIVGVGIIVYGVWDVVVPEESRVEIISGSQSSPAMAGQGSELGRNVTVDVAGAVETPGVYQLPSSSRIGDALVAAGGLASGADREWVAQTLNLAEVVKDGEKIYIPVRQQAGNSANQQASQSVTPQGKVNINTASVAELDSLSGIGEVRAQVIIASRPYKSVEELVSKAKIPQSVYDKIKTQVSVY